jgi:hypothetical protein
MKDLAAFKAAVANNIHNHPVVRMNPYTSWFSQGEATLEELRAFTVQFSVFSHLFIEAQLRKCINAPDILNYRAGKEILLNELGVTFCENGSVENGKFTFRAAHFEWLTSFAQSLGLSFGQIGKRRHGSPETLAFCDALMRWYASEDFSESTGASFAIEHWAAAGFWKDLIGGLSRIKATRIPNLPLGFWVWHDQLEDQHAAHTDDELTAAFSNSDFNEAAFLRAGTAVLDAVELFWNGLMQTRSSLAA